MTAITIDRALLEQVLEALDVSRRFVYQDSRPQVDAAFDALNAELAKPVKASQTASQLAATVLADCGISTDCTALLMVVAARIAQGEVEMIDNLKKLAKPVEQDAQITLEQFRAIAHRTATTYRHRSDPEKSSYAFVDGSSLDDFWRKVCEAIQPTPAWRDAPTCEGVWLSKTKDGDAPAVGAWNLPPELIDRPYWSDMRWYGPIPQDNKKGNAA